MGSAERLFEIIDARSTLPDEGTRTLQGPREEVRFEQVRFAYADTPVLDGVRVAGAPAGQMPGDQPVDPSRVRLA